MNNKESKYWNSFKTRTNPFGITDIDAEKYLRAEKVGWHFLSAYFSQYPFIEYFFTGIICYTFAAMLTWLGLLVVIGSSFLWLPEYKRKTNEAAKYIGRKYIEVTDEYEQLRIGYDQLKNKLNEAEKTIEELRTKRASDY